MTEMEILQAARKAYRKLWAGLMAVKPQLDTRYPDDPRWTPWTRFVEPRLTDLSDALTQEPTLTASEVKVLTETASKVAYALGRKDAGEEIAAAITAHRDADDSTREFRLGLSLGAKFARDVASQPSEAASDATSGVPGHPEVSEAVRSPQEPCGNPTCPCAVEVD